MFFVFRLAFLILPFSFIWAILVENNWKSLLDKGIEDTTLLICLCIIAITIFARFVVFKRHGQNFFTFWDTFEHEFSHILFAYLHFKTPGELKIDSKGTGHITLNNTTTIICLAPYFFPLYALLFYSISPLFQDDIQIYLLMISAMFLGNYFYRLKKEIHRNQTDFNLASFPISMLWIFSLNLCWILLLICHSTELSSYSENFFLWWKLITQLSLEYSAFH